MKAKHIIIILVIAVVFILFLCIPYGLFLFGTVKRDVLYKSKSDDIKIEQVQGGATCGDYLQVFKGRNMVFCNDVVTPVTINKVMYDKDVLTVIFQQNTIDSPCDTIKISVCSPDIQ